MNFNFKKLLSAKYYSKRVLTSIVLCILLSLNFSSSISKLAPSYASASNNTISSANELVDDMKVGWNLGNTLDCYDFKKNNSEEILKFKNKYQAMATYSTVYYSGWDASSCPYFSNGVCNLTWQIKSLNSSSNGKCGVFGLQIINNTLKNSGEDKLTYTISQAKFTKSDGSVIKLDNFNKTFSSVIKNNTSQYATVDLTPISELATSADVKGGTLSLTITINDYPKSTRTDVDTSTSKYYETLYGNPVTTKALISAIKEKGFNAIRVPITYYDHILSDGSIDPDWLDRIDEIVNYILDNDMYCIINVHHDTGSNGWLRADLDTFNEQCKIFTSIWEQVANYFKDYDYHLLFESYNEILNSSNVWNYANSDSYTAANQFNQAFVDTIRASSSNNKDRYLVVSTYAASAESHVMNGFVLPKDKADDKLIVSVHSYVGTNSVSALFARIKNSLLSKGIPVIVGEFGMRNNTSTSNLDARVEYVNAYVSEATKNGITCFWWDDGGIFANSNKVTNYAIINRNTCKWYFEDIADALVNASTRPSTCTLTSTNYSDNDVWQSGEYNRFSGRYNTSMTRLCTSSYLTCKNNSKYYIDFNLNNHLLIINQYDSEYSLISSSKLSSQSSIVTSDKTAYITLTLTNTVAPYKVTSDFTPNFLNINAQN